MCWWVGFMCGVGALLLIGFVWTAIDRWQWHREWDRRDQPGE